MVYTENSYVTMWFSFQAKPIRWTVNIIFSKPCFHCLAWFNHLRHLWPTSVLTRQNFWHSQSYRNVHPTWQLIQKYETCLERRTQKMGRLSTGKLVIRFWTAHLSMSGYASVRLSWRSLYQRWNKCMAPNGSDYIHWIHWDWI